MLKKRTQSRCCQTQKNVCNIVVLFICKAQNLKANEAKKDSWNAYTKPKQLMQYTVVAVGGCTC